jgi:hypothetical protein
MNECTDYLRNHSHLGRYKWSHLITWNGFTSTFVFLQIKFTFQITFFDIKSAYVVQVPRFDYSFTNINFPNSEQLTGFVYCPLFLWLLRKGYKAESTPSMLCSSVHYLNGFRRNAAWTRYICWPNFTFRRIGSLVTASLHTYNWNFVAYPRTGVNLWYINHEFKCSTKRIQKLGKNLR